MCFDCRSIAKPKTLPVCVQGNGSQKYFQIKNIHEQPFWIVEEVLDGDSLKVRQEFGQERREIRLYGLDAPEVHFSRKMREDESKTGIPASLLLQYRHESVLSVKIINDIEASNVFTIFQSIVHEIHAARYIRINRAKQWFFYLGRKAFLPFTS